MVRADPLQPARVKKAQLNAVAALFHTSGTLDPPQGVEGTSTLLHGQERAGIGVSPAARQQENIDPESPEETWTVPHRAAAK